MCSSDLSGAAGPAAALASSLASIAACMASIPLSARFSNTCCRCTRSPDTGGRLSDSDFAALAYLGFTKGNQMKLYGEVFDVVGEPILIADEVVLLGATERKSGQLRRVCLRD